MPVLFAIADFKCHPIQNKSKSKSKRNYANTLANTQQFFLRKICGEAFPPDL